MAQWGVSAGIRTGFMTSKTLSPFIESFNKALAPTIDKGLSQPGLGLGYGAGIDYNIAGYYSSPRFSKLSSTSTVNYVAGAKRHFDFASSLITIGAGYGQADDDFSWGLPSDWPSEQIK